MGISKLYLIDQDLAMLVIDRFHCIWKLYITFKNFTHLASIDRRSALIVDITKNILSFHGNSSIIECFRIGTSGFPEN